VPRKEIDEVYFNSPYYIVPDGEVGQQAFAVIREAIRQEGMVAIGKVVFTSREHVIALEARDKGLLGVTLRYPYEVRKEEEYFDDIPEEKLPKDMLDLAKHIVDSKKAEWKPERFEDQYEDALKESNIKLNKDLIIDCPSGSFEEGKRAIKKALDMPNPPDAIFATNDPMAMGAMMAIKEKGMKIPQDVAVVGFSNWFFGELMEPSLTTVDQPGFEMGQEAARMLIKQIEMKDKGDPVLETKILKTKLVIRNIGLILSGAMEKPILDADTIVADNGRITAIGRASR